MIEEKINRLFDDIPDSERKSQLLQEVTQNLEEKVADLMVSGKSEEDAVNKAIVEFGDIGDIKEELAVRPNPRENRRCSKNAGLSLGFSVWGSGLIIALCVFINFYYSPHVIWFVYPTFAVLWWPLAMFYRWLRIRKEDDNHA